MNRRKRCSKGPLLRKIEQVAYKTSSSRDNFQTILEDTSATSQLTASELSISSKPLQLPQSKDTLVTSARVQIGTAGNHCSSTQGNASRSPPSVKVVDLKLPSPFPADPPVPSLIHGISSQHSPLPTILTQSPTNVDLPPPSPTHTDTSVITSYTDKSNTSVHPPTGTKFLDEYPTVNDRVVLSTAITPISSVCDSYGCCNSGALASEDDISTAPHFNGISSTSQRTDALNLCGCNATKYADTPHTPNCNVSEPSLCEADTSPFVVGVKSPMKLRISLPSPIGSRVSPPISADISMLSTAGCDISTSSPISCHISTPLHSSSYIAIPSSKSGDISAPMDSDTDMCTSSETSTYATAMSPTNDITETSSNEDHHLTTFTSGGDISTAFKADSDITPYLTCCNSLTQDLRDTNVLVPNDATVSAPSPEGVYGNDNIPGPSSRETFICEPSSGDTVTFASSSETALTVSTISQMIGTNVHVCSSIHTMTCAPSDIVDNESGPPYLRETTITPSFQDGLAPQTTVHNILYPNSPLQPDTVLSQQSIGLHLTSAATKDIPGTILQCSTVHWKPHASQDGNTPRSISASFSEVSLVEEIFPDPEIHDSSEATSVVLNHSQDALDDHPSKISESNTPNNEHSRIDVLEWSSDALVSSSPCSSCSVSESLFSCVVPESSPLNTLDPQSYVCNNGSEPPLLVCAVPTSSTVGSINEGPLNCTSVTQALSRKANLESHSTPDPEPCINVVFPAACPTNIPKPASSTNPVLDSKSTIPVLLQDLNSCSNDADHPRVPQPQISIFSPLPDSAANPIKVTIFEASLACNSVVETSPVTLSEGTISYSDLKSHPSLHFTSDEDSFLPSTDIPNSSPKISNSTPIPSHDKKAFPSKNIEDFSSRKSLIPESHLTSTMHSDQSLLGRSAKEISTISDFANEDLLASTVMQEPSPVKTAVSIISPTIALTDKLKTLSLNPVDSEPPSFATDTSVFFPLKRRKSQPFLPGTHISVLSSDENNIPVLSLTESDVSKLSPFELNIWESLSLETDTTTPFTFEDVTNVPTSASDTSASAVGVTVPTLFQMCTAENHDLCNSTTYDSLSTSSSQESLQETSVKHSVPKVATPYPFQRLCTTIPNPNPSLESTKNLCHRSISHNINSPSHKHRYSEYHTSQFWIKDASIPQPFSMVSLSKGKSNISAQSPSLDKICDDLPPLFTSKHNHVSDSLPNEIPNNSHTQDLVPPECIEFRTQTTDCLKKSYEGGKKAVEHNKVKRKSYMCKFTKPKVTILNAPITSRAATKDSVHLHSTKKPLVTTTLNNNKSTSKLSPLKNTSEILEAIRKGDFPTSKPVQKKKTKFPSERQGAPKSTVAKTKKASNKSLLAVPSLSIQKQSNSQENKSWIKTSVPLPEVGSMFSRPIQTMLLSPTSDARTELGTKEGNKLLGPPSLKHILSVFLQQGKPPKSCTQDVFLESSAMKTPPTQLPSKSSGKSVLKLPKSSDKNESEVHKSKLKDNESSSILPKGPLDLKYLEKEEICLKPVLVFSDISSSHSSPDKSSKSCSPRRSPVALPSKSASKRTMSNVFSSIHQKLKHSKILQPKHLFHRSLHTKFPPSKRSKLESLPTVSEPKLHRQKLSSTLTCKVSAFKPQLIQNSASETTELKHTVLEMDLPEASYQIPRYETNMTKSYEMSTICHTSKCLSPKTTKPIFPKEKNNSSTPCTQIYGGSKSLKHKADVPYSHSSKYLEFKNAILCANKQSSLKKKYFSSIPLRTKSQLFKNLLTDHSVSRTDQHNRISLKCKLSTNLTAPEKTQLLKSTVPWKPSLTDPDECSPLELKSDPFASTAAVAPFQSENKPFVASTLPQKKKKPKSATPLQRFLSYENNVLFSKSKPDIALSLPAVTQDLIIEDQRSEFFLYEISPLECLGLTFSDDNQSPSTSSLPECSHVKSTPSKSLASKIPKRNYHKNKHGGSKYLELETKPIRFPNSTHASRPSYLQSAQTSDLHIPKSHGHKQWQSKNLRHKACKQKFSSNSRISRLHTQNNSVSRRGKKVHTKRNDNHKLSLFTYSASGPSDSTVQLHNKTQSLHKETRRKPRQRSKWSFRNAKERSEYCPRTSIQKHHHSGQPYHQAMQLESDNNSITEQPSMQHVQHRNALLQPNNQYQTEQSSSNDKPLHLFDPEERGINSLDTHTAIIDRVCNICGSFYKTFYSDLVLYCYMCHAMITKIASCLKASLCVRCLQPFIRVLEEKEKEEVCHQCLQEYVVTN